MLIKKSHSLGELKSLFHNFIRAFFWDEKKTDTRLKRFQTKRDWLNEFIYYPKSFGQSNPVIHLSPIYQEGVSVIYLSVYVCVYISIFIF